MAVARIGAEKAARVNETYVRYMIQVSPSAEYEPDRNLRVAER
jgi:hypothetical protein